MGYPGGADQRDRLVNLLIDSVENYAIFVLDPDGVVRTWNAGAERLKGYERDEIVGQHFSVFYTPDDREAGLPQEMLRLAEAEGRVERRGWRVRADGSLFWGDITLTVLRDDDDQLVGFAKVTRDLTQEHETQVARAEALERERQAAKELAELDEMRSRVLAGVSHDLTTPIAAIRGVVELLIDATDVDEEERQEMLALIARNSEQLNNLTEQLGELSRLQRGRLELHPRPLDLRETAESCVKDLGPLLDGLTVDVASEDTVEADPLALRRVLTNLLTNAARHSPDGGRIRVVSERRDGRIAVGVTDDGPGIVQDDQHRIFDEFDRGSSPAGSGKALGMGLGLGLSIVRLYVEQHGGSVWVDSAEGSGATFWFTLPAA
jgi:PAS domain S-box-containing protein